MPLSAGCDHARHSAVGKFAAEHGSLRFVLVCDVCGAEQVELQTLGYELQARPFANSLAETTARELGLEEEVILRVRLAALLRDVGKAQIPASILNKRGTLTDREWNEIHRHPEMGAAMLTGTSFDDIRAWILCHHERPDGRGYPRGLKGSEIPLEARILAVVDAYEAMIADRPYRAALSQRAAFSELRQGAGTQFDARVVRALVSTLQRSRAASPRRERTRRAA